MNKKLISAILTLALLLSLLPGLALTAAADDEDYVWPEMIEGVAMRYTVNKTESTRILVGETFKVEFWINGIAPYSMVIPLAWDPTVVQMIDEATGEPVTSGRKLESETGIGFRPGASCFDPSFDEYYRPKYWNGKPVYSDKESSEGYPYIDNENGYCTFLFYVDAATPSVQSQMFLELTFTALRRGEPDFHFATDREAIYDPASPHGLTMGFTDGGVVDSGLEMPGVYIISSYTEETTVPPNPGVKPTDKEITSGGSTTTPSSPTTVLPETDMISATHLSCYPYAAPVYAQAIVKHEVGQNIQKSDNYILPESTLADAINRLVNSSAGAIVAKMPNRIIDKENYSISFSCANLDDLVNRMSAMLYFETPYGYVGVNPAALLSQVGSDKAEVMLSADPAPDGIKLGVKVNGRSVSGFAAPVFLLILPYDGEAAPLVTSAQVFGSSYQSLGQQPLSISSCDLAKHAVCFFTPAAGTYTLSPREAKTFDDLPEDFWATAAVTELSAAGIVKGRTETEYVPNGTVTRAEMAKLLVCAMGMYQTRFTAAFEDVEDGQWFYPYVASAHAVGMINGQSETQFGSTAEITRQDMAVMAYRGLKLLGVSLQPQRDAPDFTDGDDIADYAQEAVTALYQAGLLNGMGDGSFCPRGTTNRAQAAQLIYGVYRQVCDLL